MPTISGAIAKATAFQASRAVNNYQAIFASTGTVITGGIYIGGNTIDGIHLIASSNHGIGLAVNNGAPTLYITNAGVTNITGAAVFGSTVTTGAPTGGAGAWKLGIANAVSPTSPNRTVTVDIGGTLYYLAAKLTND